MAGPLQSRESPPYQQLHCQEIRNEQNATLTSNSVEKKTPHTPLADIFVRESDWQKDDQTPVAHNDLYAQSWITNFGPNPFEDSPPDHTQNTDDIEYQPIEEPDNNPPLSLEFPKNSGGSPVEQSTEREEENHDEIQQEIQDDETEISQKTPKEKTQEKQTQKTPENSQNTPLQEEPINTRGEKYNLRPNPNPNFSDSYRY